MRLYDAHNHLQDDRLKPWRGLLVSQATEAGVKRMVVNGSCEDDWAEVLVLAQQYPQAVPSFGYHPWYVQERTLNWRRRLVDSLDRIPSAVGEIGLDRWVLGRNRSAPHAADNLCGSKHQSPDRFDAGQQPECARTRDRDFAEQQEVFVWQLRLAAERNLPVSIHCLQAWGALYNILRREPRPTCGFLLHSYGGPVEMVGPLANLGAYFSLPGYFAHERKRRQRKTFLHIPPDRLLIETDAPDQCLPDERNRFPLTDAKTGKMLNHPANITAVYEFAAELFGESPSTLANRVEGNFQRLFGAVLNDPGTTR